MSDSTRSTPDEHADPAVDGDVTEPLGGATSGEEDYVAANGSGVSGDRHNPTPDEEIGRDEGDDSDTFEPETQG